MTNETATKKVIKEYFRLMGIDFFYNLQGMGSYPGIADLCFFYPRLNKLIFLEVKAPKGKLSEHQINFRAMVEQHEHLFLVARSLDDVMNFIKVGTVIRD